MKKHILIFLIVGLIVISHNSKAQYFYFTFSDTDIVAIPGSGLDIKLLIDFEGSNPDPVILKAETPKGIRAIFQPDTVTSSQNVILSVIVEDTNLRGQTRNFNISASDGKQTNSVMLHLQIPDDIYVYSEYAHLYRDSALHYLYKQYPGMLSQYGNLITYPWQGFWPWPILLVVSNYNFLYDDWRINVLWHNMIYPHNWEKVFVFNEALGFCKGVKIDSIGNCSEITCEKNYYFQNLQPTEIPDEKQIVQENQILMYPVPARNYVNFTAKNSNNHKIKSICIIDRQGKILVKTVPSDNSGSLDISDLSAGVYIIIFDYNNQLLRKKLLVY
jgi:hypothetical protein